MKNQAVPNINLTDFREKFEMLVPMSSDMINVILKGHLIIEELLCQILKSHCENYESLLEANLTFYQKACVAKGLMSSIGTVYFTSIFSINQLRNDLAHNITSSKRNNIIVKFIEKTKGLYGEQYNETETIDGRLRNAVCQTIYGLSVSEGLSLIWLEKD